MKKFSLLLMIVLIVGAIFVSCSAEPSADATKVATVALSLDTAKELEAHTDIEYLPAANTLYWYYTATKNDSGFKTGETGNVKTPLWGGENMVKGLPTRIGEISGNSASGTWFSTGSWVFHFYAYKEANTSGNSVYEAEVTVQVSAPTSEENNIGGTANIVLQVAHDPRQGSTIKMATGTEDPALSLLSIDLGNAYDSNATYTLTAYVDGEPVLANDVSVITTIKPTSGTVLRFSCSSDLKTYDNPNNQFHLVEFKLTKGSDTTVYASGSIALIARMGYTYIINGSLDSLESVAWVGINATLPENLDSANQTITELTISNESQLRAFAAYVNQGNNCAGMTIKLADDITLHGDWIPIGNSARKTADKYFAGTFNGQYYTISGLKLSEETKNLMYDENQTDSSADGMYFNEYIFGLFGVVKNATIMNLTLADVDIKSLNRDIDSTHKLTGENVGALIGYSNGSLAVANVTVSSGSIAGSNVAGIIGRAYGAANGSISILSCTNSADITAENGSGNKAKAAGIVGYVSGLGATVEISQCINEGALSSTAERNAIAAGIANYGFNDSVKDDYTVRNNTSSGTITLSDNGPLYATISAECNEGIDSNDLITVSGNVFDGQYVKVGDNFVTDDTPLVRSSQNGAEVQN